MMKQRGLTSIKYNGSGGDIVIPSGVATIGNGVFADRRDLTDADIPYTVTIIGGSAFTDCTSLADVTIPKGVKTSEGIFAGTPWLQQRQTRRTKLPFGSRFAADCTKRGAPALADAPRFVMSHIGI